MEDKKLLDRIAYLESLNDQLGTEIKYVDRLLRQAGFTEGLKTLKNAALELIKREEREMHEQEEEETH